MLSPTSTSAMSTDKISNAVPASRPLPRTKRLISSGFSRTTLCVADEPIVVTMPSPTRARTVASPAPPTNPLMFARTVTRANAFSSTPSCETPATTGVSRTLGITDICTASRGFLPARSIAEACSNVRSILARWAEIIAMTTVSTFPRAMKCVSS